MKSNIDRQRWSQRRQVYLLTCILGAVEGSSDHGWRFSLETAHSRDRELFTSLEEVMAAIDLELQTHLNLCEGFFEDAGDG